MKLKDYLIKYRIEPVRCAVECKLCVATIYRYLKGHKAHARNAKIIERWSKAEVSYEEMIHYDRKK